MAILGTKANANALNFLEKVKISRIFMELYRTGQFFIAFIFNFVIICFLESYLVKKFGNVGTKKNRKTIIFTGKNCKTVHETARNCTPSAPTTSRNF